MKTLFTLFLVFILCLQANAQLSDSINYKPAVIYYNAEYQVTKKEFAAYARVAYFPDRLIHIRNLEGPRFNGPIKDYYADGTLLANGNYNKGRAIGSWNFYYPNGQLDCRGNYDGPLADGKWEFWWPDGKPLMVAEFKQADMRLMSFWNENGDQTIKDGNGIYKAITTNEEGKQMKMEGSYKDGYQFGRWTFGPVTGELLAEQTFDNKGNVIVGISYEEKRKKKYTGNRFKVMPLPNHLVPIDFWSRDPKVYSADYPLLADALGFRVQRIDLVKDKQTIKDHYYKIYQEHATGTDTLIYGIPMTRPVFGKSIVDFLNWNVKYPQQLNNQNLEGLIVVQFSIKEDGSIKNPAIVKGLHPQLDQEVLRVFKKMPKWKPATRNGTPIERLATYPLKFTRRIFVEATPENGVLTDINAVIKDF